MVDLEVGPHRNRSRVQLESALPFQDERPCQNRKRHKARDRIARQADERHAKHVTERQRLAGLDRNLPQVDRPFGLNCGPHVVRFADRDAAAADHQIRPLGSLSQGSARRLQLIRHDAQVDHFAPQGPQQGGKQKPVRVVDAAGRQRLARHDQFVAGEQHTDPKPPVDRKPGQTDRGRKADVRRAQARSAFQHAGSELDVHPRRPDPLARRRHREHHDPIGLQLRGFLRHDGVTAGWNRRSGENARSRTRGQRLAHPPRLDSLRHRQAGRDRSQIRAAHGVAVHLGVVQRRHRDARDDRLGQHASEPIDGAQAPDRGKSSFNSQTLHNERGDGRDIVAREARQRPLDRIIAHDGDQVRIVRDR